MSIYFADLMEENKALMLALLRLKAETATLEPGEAELLDRLRSHDGLPEETQFPMAAPPAVPRWSGHFLGAAGRPMDGAGREPPAVGGGPAGTSAPVRKRWTDGISGLVSPVLTTSSL